MFWRMLIGNPWRFFNGLRNWLALATWPNRDDDGIENLLRFLAFIAACFIVNAAVYAGLVCAGRALHFWA